MVEPYKAEILPHWRFKNPPTATESSSKLLSIFHSYLEEDDFVGADMTRKFIQMATLVRGDTPTIKAERSTSTMMRTKGEGEAEGDQKAGDRRSGSRQG